MSEHDGVRISDREDWLDALQFRPGEFVVCFVDWRADSVKVSADLGGDPVDEGPSADFRRRGGGVHLLCPGDIVPRTRVTE